MSKDGLHKVAAIWEYDKRPANGAAFVYYGSKLITTESAQSQEMVRYADNVLDALYIRNGPSHMELICCDDGPYLVEVGSRCQGGKGTWIQIAQDCIGYTQVSLK